MKKNIYLLGIFILLNLVFITNLIHSVHADSNQEITNVLEEYYSSFESFDLEGYLNTQDLRLYNDSTLEIKKKNIEIMWENVEPTYHHISNLNINVNDSTAFVSYDLEAGMKDYNSGEEFRYEVKMGAILTKINGTWKISKITPLAQLDEFIEVNNIEESIDELNKSLNDDFVNETYQFVFDDFDNNKTINDSEIIEKETNSSETKFTDLENNKNKESEITCKFNTSLLKYVDNINIKKYVSARVYDMLVGDFAIKLVIDNSKTYLFEINNGILNLVDKTSKEIKYSINVDSCTLLAIQDKTLDPMTAYEEDLIELNGETIGSKVKLGLGKIGYWFYSFFKGESNSDGIILDAKDFKLENPGRYSSVGGSPRGEPELYLGTGGSSATLVFNIDKPKKYFVYVKISDDKKHRDGSRSVELIFNDESKLNYNHKSENTITPKSAWAWQYVGEIELKNGQNKLTILKPKQTSAAFIMSKIALFETKIPTSKIEE